MVADARAVIDTFGAFVGVGSGVLSRYPIRYMQWCFTTPALIMLVAQLANEPVTTVLPTMVVDVAMVVTGWVATWAPFWYLWLAASTACFMWVMYTQHKLFDLAIARAMHVDDTVLLRHVRAYTHVIWAAFPTVWCLSAMGAVSPAQRGAVVG